MRLLIPVLLVDMPALRTSLAGILRIHNDHGRTMPARLIPEFCPQVVETPADRFITMLQCDFFGCLAYSGQILQHKKAPGWILSSECLRYLMVYIRHPTVFSLPNLLEPAPGGWRLLLLETSPGLLILRPLLLYVPAMEELRLPLTVIRNSEKVDAKVNANDIGDVGSTDFGNVLRHRNMEKPFPVLCNQFCCPKFPGSIKVGLHTLREKRELHTPFKGVDRKNFSFK